MNGDGRPTVIRPEYLEVIVVSNLNRRLEVALGQLADAQERIGALEEENEDLRRALASRGDGPSDP